MKNKNNDIKTTGAQSTHDLNALIIDPDIIQSKGASLALKEFFSDITVLQNPFKATEALLDKHFDLIITEIQFRTVDGLKLIKTLQKLSPKSHILVCTAYCTENIKKQLENLGIHTLLEKPMDVIHLKETLVILINKLT